MKQTGKFCRSRSAVFTLLDRKNLPGNNKQRIIIRELRYSLRLKNLFKFDFLHSGLLSYHYPNVITNCT
jgi:hypothetical protein